jgi:hypothetical protein
MRAVYQPKTKYTYFFFTSIALLSASLFFSLFLPQPVYGAAAYQISGYYLGATPEEVGVIVETDPRREEKFYEIEEKGVRLFFVQVEGDLRVYRIIEENAVKQDGIKSIIDSLKAKYGAPDKQQIKSVSMKSYRGGLNTSIKNRAIWNISDSQRFIAEIESKRVVYELLDNEPEKIKPPAGIESLDSQGFGGDGWDTDY